MHKKSEKNFCVFLGFLYVFAVPQTVFGLHYYLCETEASRAFFSVSFLCFKIRLKGHGRLAGERDFTENSLNIRSLRRW